MSIGNMLEEIIAEHLLESIAETIIVADKDYKITWMNTTAATNLQPLLKLYGLNDSKDAIGITMDFFHKHVKDAREIMSSLTESYRTRITIKNRFVAETVISPIWSNHELKGYILMLLDITTQALLEHERSKLIKELSTPLLKIWDGVLALPLVGSLDHDRADVLVEFVLNRTVEEKAEYVLIDLSSLSEIDESTSHQLNKLHESLRLIGTKCFLVGSSPSLALSMTHANYSNTWTTYKHVQQAIQAILELKKMTLIKYEK